MNIPNWFKKYYLVIIIILVIIILASVFVYQEEILLFFYSLQSKMNNCELIKYEEGETFCPEGYYVPEVSDKAQASGYMRCCKEQ
jgi:hypothetical protein